MQKHAYGCHQMVAQTRASKKFGILLQLPVWQDGIYFSGCAVTSCWGPEVPYMTYSTAVCASSLTNAFVSNHKSEVLLF